MCVHAKLPLFCIWKWEHKGTTVDDNLLQATAMKLQQLMKKVCRKDHGFGYQKLPQLAHCVFVSQRQLQCNGEGNRTPKVSSSISFPRCAMRMDLLGRKGIHERPDPGKSRSHRGEEERKLEEQEEESLLIKANGSQDGRRNG